MSTVRIAISNDNKITAVDENSVLGQLEDGRVVHEVFNCPQEVQIEDISFLISQGNFEANTYRHDFNDLASANSSCCGQCS